MNKESLPVWYKILFCLWVSLLIATGVPKVFQRIGLPQKQFGTPQVITEHIVFDDTPISQIVDDGKYLYVLADEHQGYIQVYTLNGEYLHTLSFYYTSNGCFGMAVDNNMLYVRDIERNIYIFENGIFKEFLIKDRATQVIQEESFDNWSSRYEIRQGAVWRVDLQEPVRVIARSISAAIHQYHLNWVIIIGSMLILVVLGIHITKRSGTGDSTVCD